MADTERIYQAMIWLPGPDQTGQRVSISARDLDEARSLLEKEYGKGNVYNLHSEEDAKRIR